MTRGAKVDDTIISPVKNRNDPELPERVIFTPTLQIAGILLRLSKWKVTRFKRFDITLLAILKDSQGKIALVGPGMGAPMASAIIEKVIACGGKKILMVGCCGSLSRNLKIGDFFIPEKGISGEGTSQHYLKDNEIPLPDKKTIKVLEKTFIEEGLDIKKGKIWTTDAPYRETKDKVINLANQGTMAVDMEFTALCSVAAFRKIPFASLMIVSDELFDCRWNPGFSSQVFRKSLKAGCRTVLKVAENLIY